MSALSAGARARRVPVLACLVGSMLATTSAAVQATERPAGEAPGRHVFQVRMSDEGLRAPAAVPAGPVQLNVSSADGKEHGLEIFQPRRGTPVEQVMRHLRGTSLANPPRQVAEAARRVDREAEFFGGAQVQRDRPVRMSVTLCPGTYRLVDLTQVLQGPARTQKLRVTGNHAACNGPSVRNRGPQATVSLVPTANGPRFRSPDSLPARGAIRFVNATDQGGEMLLQRLRPGATPAQVRTALEQGCTQPRCPFDGPAFGLNGMSAENEATLFGPGGDPVPAPPAPRPPAPRPARYVLMSSAPDIDAGVAQTQLGAWRIVTLR
ncbi:hypothetical protein [Streptomyces sp. NPDC047108]|uniref:hypothetical protein n=1 Tax=Streptomyces sp. NPDC047108 TaxID=3155025 RepID=UPI0033C20106